MQHRRGRILKRLAAGNYLPDYKDNSGSIGRRNVIFLLEQLVTERDTRLKEKIELELPTLVLRCIRKYMHFVKNDGNKDIWDLVPAQLREQQEVVRTETNPLYKFIQGGDNYYEILYDESSATLLSDFQSAYKNHMQFCLQQKYTWTGDYYPFKCLGYTISEKNICKACGKSANDLKMRDGKCCNDYDRRNRKKVTVIERMQLYKKKGRFTIQDDNVL